jgi:hypothetical protein
MVQALSVDGLHARECGIGVVKNFRGDERCGALQVVIVTLRTPGPSLGKPPQSSASTGKKRRFKPQNLKTAFDRIT